MSSTFWNESSVIFPDGTISQTWRGASSCFASARTVFAVEVTFGSNDFISTPCCSRRFVIPAPIRPSPTIPSCMSDVLQSNAHDAAAALLERGEVTRGLRADQAAEAEVAAG